MTKNEKASATDKAGVALYKEKQVVFEGAIPHPDILKGYGEIDKSYPERIIKLAENHAKTEDASQSALVKAILYIWNCRNHRNYIFRLKRKYTRSNSNCHCCHSTSCSFRYC